MMTNIVYMLEFVVIPDDFLIQFNFGTEVA